MNVEIALDREMVMKQTLQYIFIFFKEPTNLFNRLKEKPNLKGSLIIIIMLVLLYQVAGIRTGSIELKFRISTVFALLFSFTTMLGIVSLGVMFESLYILLFSKIFKKKVNFKSILSAIIYCTIPIVLNIIIQIAYPTDFSLSNILKINDVHLFFNVLYKRVELFQLWSNIMEIIAIKILVNIDYYKGIIIVISSWLISIVLAYLYTLAKTQ